MEYDKKAKIPYRILDFIITLLVLLCSFFVLYRIRLVSGSLPSSSSCLAIQKNFTYNESAITQQFANPGQKFCFCAQQNINNLLNNDQINHICADYLKSIKINLSIKLSVGLFIVVVNELIEFLVEKMSDYERFTRETRKKQHILTRVFLMMFINSAFCILLANILYSESIPFIFNGKYSDLNREWYLDVGATITVTVILSVFAPHMLQLLIVFPFARLKKLVFSKFCKTQSMNKPFLGPYFNISNSLSQVLTVVFTSYMFSPGMPLLNVLCFISMGLTYLSNKVLLFRYYRKPPGYSGNINKRVILLMPLAIVFHCIIAIVAYGAPDIFPVNIEIAENNQNLQWPKFSFFDRCKTDFGIANIIMIGISLVLFGVMIGFSKKYERINSQKVFERSLNSKKDSRQMIKENEILNVISYDILSNPKYTRLIVSFNAAADRRQEEFIAPLSLVKQPSIKKANQSNYIKVNSFCEDFEMETEKKLNTEDEKFDENNGIEENKESNPNEFYQENECFVHEKQEEYN